MSPTVQSESWRAGVVVEGGLRLRKAKRWDLAKKTVKMELEQYKQRGREREREREREKGSRGVWLVKDDAYGFSRSLSL
nr:hypothetical protein CFP56_14528 [Quercus suber]